MRYSEDEKLSAMATALNPNKADVGKGEERGALWGMGLSLMPYLNGLKRGSRESKKNA